MTYRIRVEPVGQNGTPSGQAWLHEADTAPEALALAADEIGSGRSGDHCTATVVDSAGLPVLVYTGHAVAGGDAARE